ncbi:hypothetical protein MO973_31815 [Paenibacillus sp. TRM 82003]|uniref:aggregation-promoting factor C-terminal-like domain-containing protein n=1 Tax=Kineococcus sp. TRM81007 TaxID=2925831 RepID=UPI001F568678|nr:hypothetical protein [Kineococcus sp. TRM81007]MCI2239125.1 hypothetical protein [Kineococcus sp. TRM81007]MCI3924805.1 hypothetical protein [Paenibacillus sp. TRM 82003]
MPTTAQNHSPHDPSQDRPAGRASGARRWRLAAPAALAVGAVVLGGAVLTGGPAPEAEAAVPDHVLAAVSAELRSARSAAWFDARELRAAADARVEAERIAAEEARLAAEAEAVRLAEEARLAAEAEAARSAQRDPKPIARQMAAERGWGEGQFSCLDSLWTKESGWKWNADNPTSSAYGIPQSLPGSKMATAGADWETNPVTQIAWGLDYIDRSYGTPCAAWSHSQSHNWY